MLIGVYVANYNPLDVMPEERCYSIAAEAKMQGCEVVFFKKSDVNYKLRKIIGTVRENGTWVQKELDLPDVLLDEGLTLLKEFNKEIPEVELLINEIPIMRFGLPDKIKIYEKIKSDGKYAKYIPPYSVTSKTNIIYDFLDKHNRIVLKPVEGRQGKSIAYVEKKANYYFVKQHTKKHKFNNKEFKKFSQLITDESVLVQPYLECRTKQGHPFDFRIHVQRNGQGSWEITKVYPRIGKKESILSNISRDGITADIKYFLMCEYGEKDQEIYDLLCNLALQLTEHVNNFYAYPLDEVGVDLAIDKNGDVWLYEVNAGPQTKNHEWERAKNTIAYAKYVAEKSQVRHILGKMLTLSANLEKLINLEESQLNENLLTKFCVGFQVISDRLKPRYLYFANTEIEPLTKSVNQLIDFDVDSGGVNLDNLKEIRMQFNKWLKCFRGILTPEQNIE